MQRINICKVFFPGIIRYLDYSTTEVYMNGCLHFSINIILRYRPANSENRTD